MKGVKKIKKEGMELIKKANSPEYETQWENGVAKSKKKSEIKKGRLSRARGGRFELKVRHDLEEKGRSVDKWSNNVDLEEGKLIIAKRKFNPFLKAMTLGTGFPDFVTFSHVHDGFYSVIGVEVKINGTLSKIEKEKCRWLIQNKIFSDIWIAKEKKTARKTDIEYLSFREKYMKEPNKA